jgi:hypothetical protein
MTMLNRKFSSPKQRDVEQWRKLQQLVELGFHFFSVYRLAANGKKIPVPYPARLSDVQAFAKEFGAQSALCHQSAVERVRNQRAVPRGDA